MDLSHDVGAGAGHIAAVSTRILHADRKADVGHGAVHAPVHTSVLYGYGSALSLQEVCQGHKPGYTYARQGNPTGAALEAELDRRAPPSASRPAWQRSRRPSLPCCVPAITW